MKKSISGSKSPASTSSAAKSKHVPEYIKGRKLSKDDLENEEILLDLEKNKTKLRQKISNNNDRIIELKRQNRDILRQKVVNETQYLSNEIEIEELEAGNAALVDFGKRFYE